VVHETHRPPAPALRFVDQVVGDWSADVEFRFSQGVMTRFDVDVVHVAQPHLDLLLGTRGASASQRLLATLALARNLRRHRIALVQTLDGMGKRRSSRLVDRVARRVLDRATTRFVVLDEFTITPDPARTTVIPHAHFRDRYAGYPRGERVTGRVLCIAAGSLPSDAAALLAIPHVANTPDLSVRLAGIAPPPIEAGIRSVIARHRSVVSARLERLSDGAQVQEIDAAELVVFPRIKSLEDLQTMFLALSLDRPVLTRGTESLERLATVVGPGWIHLCEGPITAEAVDDAFGSLRRSDRASRPELSGRDLATTSTAYADMLRAAAHTVKN
jgi:beta-1,4-mannosyltransferase